MGLWKCMTLRTVAVGSSGLMIALTVSSPTLSRSAFLKRCEFPGVAAKDLYIGSMITVYSRQLKIVEYADEFTRSKLETLKGRTLAMIKPDAYSHIGDILTEIVKAG
ncbi:hypothetical protein FOZ61_004525, partial [Perkinsus olseni]